MAAPVPAQAALLALVEDDRARRIATLESETAAQVRDLLRTARAGARQRVREALAQERRRLRERIGAAEAALDTARRNSDSHRFAALLARATALLPEALEDCWKDAPRRRAWAAHVLGVARDSLDASDRVVEHAPGWPPQERDALVRDLAPDAACVEDPSLRAGLRVRAAGNVVDGTLRGLLADRDAVGARLLDLFRGLGGERP